MKALISPNEPRETGYRVAAVEQTTFDVAAPLFWVECEDTVCADTYWYDPKASVFNLAPVVEGYPRASLQEATEPQPIVQGAQTL